MERKIQVINARLEDYEAVMSIKNIKQELDYLPSLYHNLISDTDSAYYICLVDGETAGFEGISILDDNTTLMLRSLRVKKKFQGQAIPSLLRSKIYEDFKNDLRIKRVRTACSDTGHYVQSNKFRSQNTTLKIEKDIHFSDVDVSHINPGPLIGCEAKSITWERYSHLMKMEAVKKYLYPDGLITAGFWFYDADPCNIRHLRKWVHELLVSPNLWQYLLDYRDEQKKNLSDELREVYNEGKSEVFQGLVGLVVPYFSRTHLCFNVNIAGHPTKGAEVEEIRSILRPALCYAQTLCSDHNKPQRINFLFFCNEDNISDKHVYEIAQSMGLQPSKRGPIRRQYYFEQDLETFCHHLQPSAIIA